MARKRFVSPSFFAHGDLYDAEASSGLPLRVAFAGLWTQADRRGVFAWKPRELKLQVLPYDAVDFGAVLEALERARFVRSYVVAGKRYGHIPSLAAHQNFHPQEKPDATIPDPPSYTEDAAEMQPSYTEDAAEMQPRCSGDAAEMQQGCIDDALPASNGLATAAVLASNAASTTDTITTTTARPTVTEGPCSEDAPTVGRSDVAQHRTGIQALTPAEHRTLDAKFGGERREQSPTPAPSVYQQQEAELRAAALPHEALALDALLRDHRNPDALILELYSFAVGMKLCRGETTGRQADVTDVMRAVAEMAANGAEWSVRLFRGYLRRVADQKPEPATTAERRAAKLTADITRHMPAVPTKGERNGEGHIVAVPIVVAVEETADQIAARRKASADAIAQFRQQFRLYNPQHDDEPPADFGAEDAA